MKRLKRLFGRRIGRYRLDRQKGQVFAECAQFFFVFEFHADHCHDRPRVGGFAPKELDEHFASVAFVENFCLSIEFPSAYLRLENWIGLNILEPIGVGTVGGFDVVCIGCFVVIHYIDQSFAAFACLSARGGEQHPLRADETFPAAEAQLVHEQRNFEEEFQESAWAFFEHFISL